MIGLLFFGAIAVWGVIAIALGSKLPEWLGIKRHRTALGFVFALLVFVAPVADEIIAYPQMQRLCKEAHSFRFVDDMDAQKSYGRSVYYWSRSAPITTIFPSSIKVHGNEYGYFDAQTKEPILYSYSIGVDRGWLGIPAGSSGTAMTALIKGCQDKTGVVNGMSIEYDASGVPRLLSSSRVTIVPDPIKPVFNLPTRGIK